MITPRPYSDEQLARLRSDGQRTRLYLAIADPAPVYSCQVNQSFTSHDMVAQFDFDNAAGDLADVLPGMTVWVGSTAGASDIGICRVRKSWDGARAYIGETSEVAWQNDLHITVVDEFRPWPRHLRIVNNAPLLDYDIAYSDQHRYFDPVPIMGPHAVVWLVNGVGAAQFDASQSWVFDSAIGSINWLVTPSAGTSIRGAGTSTPTILITQPGIYRVRCLVTAVTGKSFAGYRYIFAYDDEHPAQSVFSLGNCAGDIDDGGWNFSVSSPVMPSNNLAQRLRAGSLVILHARDASYGYTPLSSGGPWDASADFSGTQGLNNWRYQYWNGTAFVDMETWDGANWLASTGGAVITSSTVHPGSGAESVARVWVAPGRMHLRLLGTVYDADPGGGDGVIARILVNDVEVWSATINNGGASFHCIAVSVEANDAVRFVIEKRTEWSYDLTAWLPVILPGMDVVGSIPGRENILALGYVAGETVVYDPEQNLATFEVRGLNAFLRRMTVYPIGLQMKSGTAAAWTDMPALSVDRALWHLLHWRSNITQCTDIVLTGDARYAGELTAPSAPVWAQIEALAGETILARPLCNHLGQLFIKIPYNLLPISNRAGIPSLMDITDADRARTLEMPAPRMPEVSRVELSGICVDAAGNGLAYFSLANGHVFKRIGAAINYERLLLVSQAQSNELAGLICASENNPYPSIPVILKGLQSGWDILPNAIADITLGDVALQASLRRVDHSYSARSGVLSTSIELVGATMPELSTNGDIPVTDDGVNVDFWTPPTMPPFPPPPELPPPYEPPSGEPPSRAWLATTQGLFYTEDFDSLAPTWVGQNSIFWRPVNVLWADMNVNGQIWALVQNDLSYAVFYGDFAGPMWLHTPESFFKGYDSIGGYAMIGMDGLSDKLMVGYGHGYPGGATRMFAASRSTAMDPGIYLAPYAEGGGNITIAGGKALLTYPTGVLFAAQITRLADDAKSQEYTAPAGGAPGGFYHFRAGRAADLIIAKEQTNTVAYTDGGEAGSILPMPLNGALGAADPTGQYIITNSGVSLHLSSDGGTSYSTQGSGNFPFAKNPYSCRVHCIDTSRWVLASAYIVTDTLPGSRVFFTPDFGASWVDKTGNLNDLVPNFAPLAIRTL